LTRIGSDCGRDCPAAALRLRLAIAAFELGKLFTTFPLA
jgi:hypothetical protein